MQTGFKKRFTLFSPINYNYNASKKKKRISPNFLWPSSAYPDQRRPWEPNTLTLINVLLNSRNWNDNPAVELITHCWRTWKSTFSWPKHNQAEIYDLLPAAFAKKKQPTTSFEPYQTKPKKSKLNQYWTSTYFQHLSLLGWNEWISQTYGRHISFGGITIDVEIRRQKKWYCYVIKY